MSPGSPTHPGAARAAYRRWVGAVFGAETAGFAFAAVAGVLSTQVDPDYPLFVGAGLVEGACLGAGQAWALRRSGIHVPAGAWTAATAAGAAIAWAIGMLPTVLPALAWSNPVVLAAAVALGACLVLAIPVLQAPLLARLGLPVGSWIALNASAWFLGVAWTLLPSPFIDEHTPVGVLLLVYVVAGALMAGTVAVITGAWVALVALPARLRGAHRTPASPHLT